MIQQPWVSENRRNLICVDAYDNGVLKGRLYNPQREMEPFSSLSQFLVKMAAKPACLKAEGTYASWGDREIC